ncbi:MAG TPA: CAP domain-containing protein [Kouleothrix sp.]|mgnify:FL=1|uniref:CAP domain-containing protein n=1 Tax=Kouleothrix sp. TaxID=2779161 RepID=UPI002CFBCB29|nr:CAP domain-containing protein [Kouleothrix sp.]
MYYLRRALCATSIFWLCLIAPAYAAAQTTATTYKAYLPLASAQLQAGSIEQQVVDLVNQERRRNGCNANLAISPKLSAAANRHSADMALHDIFSHTGSDKSTLATRARDAGYTYTQLAENIAAGYKTPQDAVNAWIKSPGHHANMLNCSLRETGIGYYYQASDQANVRDDAGNIGGPYFYYWTQDFGTQ